MLLIQLTVNGEVKYLSNEYLDIEHFYDAYVASLSQLRIETRNTYGGFAEPSFGSLDLLPNVFDGNWPPPVSCVIKVYIAVTGESDAELLFQGSAHLNTVGRDSVVYDLYGPSYTTEVTDAAYSGTIIAVFTTACTTLGLTLNSTYATSIAVSYTADGTALLIDNLSDIASFFSHRFYIEGTTLYLVSCQTDNGTTLELTEFDIFPSSYTFPSPVKRLIAEVSDTVTVKVSGSHAYGNEEDISPVCHTVSANVTTALGLIKTIIESPRLQLVMPISTVPKIGQKITLIDESLFESTEVWARVSAVVWDFDGEQCVIEGEGALA